MRMQITGTRRVWALAFCCLLVASYAWGSQTAGAQAQDDAKEFQALIQKYLAIQKKAVGSVPGLGKGVTDAALIAKHEKDVADAVRALRPDAKQGDIFTPAVRRMLAASVKQETQGQRGVDAKATILGEGNPRSGESPAPVNLVVNASYPIKAPLSTVPPSVLTALPPLPKELEFRFVGRSLILRDTRANLIVDIAPDVL